MYQISIKVNENRAFWIYALNKILEPRIKSAGGVIAVVESDGYVNLGLAGECGSKKTLSAIIADGIVELMETIGKMCYIDSKLSHLKIGKSTYRLLLHTLVAFDRECERELLLSIVKVTPFISLDGLFDFRLSELKKRWDEICTLIISNASFLHDELTLNELLRFLVSAIDPKIMKLELKQQGDEFMLTGMHNDSEFKLVTKGGDNLMLYLIDLAPIELEICGELFDSKLYCRLVEVFDAKVKTLPKNIVTNR